jgi:hypothetical protein
MGHARALREEDDRAGVSSTPEVFGMRRSARLLAVGAALALPRVAPAQIPDMSGVWQATADCGGTVAGTSLNDLFQDPNGVLTGAPATPCGFTTVLGTTALQPVTTCTASAPGPGQIDLSGDLAVPATPGTYGTRTGTFDPLPVAFSNTGCSVPWNQVKVRRQIRFDGSVTEQSGSLATRVDGTLTVGTVEFFDPGDTLCYFVPAGLIPPCTLVMLRAGVAASGSPQTVEPVPDVQITFSATSGGGNVLVSENVDPAAAVPPNFQIAQGFFYEIETTATPSGPVEVCLPYPDADQNGVVDGSNPVLLEDDVRVLHEEAGSFVDVTDSVDPVNNRVCGTVTSFSQFAVGGAASTVPDLFGGSFALLALAAAAAGSVLSARVLRRG